MNDSLLNHSYPFIEQYKIIFLVECYENAVKITRDMMHYIMQVKQCNILIFFNIIEFKLELFARATKHVFSIHYWPTLTAHVAVVIIDRLCHRVLQDFKEVWVINKHYCGYLYCISWNSFTWLHNFMASKIWIPKQNTIYAYLQFWYMHEKGQTIKGIRHQFKGQRQIYENYRN